MALKPTSRKILFLAANPKDTSRLRLDEEIRDIQEGLKLSTGRNAFEVITQWAVRTKDLRRALLEYAPQIVHFSGHGAGELGLILENEMGHAEPVAATVLVQLFKLCPSVECVVLNACYSQVQALAIAQHVPYVIGMNQAIGDVIAIQFAVGFYDALGYGRSLAEAYEFGMAAIAVEPIVIYRDVSIHAESAGVAEPVAPVLIQLKRAPSLPLRQPSTALSKKAYRDRNALLNKVKSYWIKGVLEHSLHHQVLINLGLEERIDLADPFNIVLGMVEANQHALPANSQIIDIFDELGPNCTLLILGEPGSGKTITLLQLTRDLLTRAEQDVNHPMPVVFNLSSWNGKQSIADWLIAELNSKYQIPKVTGQIWIKNKEILLLLDGLDEVRADRRDACVFALNKFQRTQGTETVICSRIQDYEALSQRLTVQQAIYIKPLQPTQTNEYLSHLRADLSGLQQILKADEALQELARSPLMLNILILAYEGIAPEDFPQMSVEAHRKQVFNTYIDRMLKRRGKDSHYSYAQTMVWLSWLAQQLVKSSQTIFLIEWLDYNWLPTNWQRWLYSILSSLLMGLAWGLIITFSIGQHSLLIGLIAGALYSFFNIPLVWLVLATERVNFNPKQAFLHQLAGSLWTGLMTGLKFGTIVGVVTNLPSSQPISISAKVWAIITTAGLTALFVGGLDWYSGGTLGLSFVKPIEALRWSWANAKKYLIFTLIGVIPFGVIQGLTNILGDNPIEGLLLAMLGSFVVGLLISLRTGAKIETRTIPNQGVWRSLKTALTTVLILSAVFVPGVHLLSQWFTVFPDLGMFFGLWLGLLMGGTACIVHLSLRLVFYWHGCMPWNYARFLDSAVKLAFLQKVGGGYIFTHRSLMEHFAQLKSSS
ncbi:NACHT domain-containing protein [Adonisia turfae]|uniref:NACHT domain-containing protein n=1 Tax=Adonisia turfae TaxID=2950184 RepID=UPI0013D0C0E8|nr:NACHT domain-containing protein [Adonisia turfae]